MANETSTPQGPSTPKAAWQTQIILFTALAASTVMYGVVLFAVLGQQLQAPTPPGIMLPIFAAVGVALILVSVVMRGKLLPPLGDDGELRSLDDVQFTEPRKAALAKLFSANILSWALVEGVAVLGFVLAFTTHDINQFFPFVAAAAVGFAINRPQQDVLLRALAAAK